MPWKELWENQLLGLYSADNGVARLVQVLTLFLLALIARQVLNAVILYAFQYAVESNRIVLSERRARTLQGLISSLITFLVSLVVIVWILLLVGVNEGIVFPILGLFSAAFGLAARPLVSDYLAGITLLFEYSYAFGEKVEIMGVIGTVEMVGLRTTRIRADSGELFIIPNGDVRLVRNFSRGAFSPASVRVLVNARDLPTALEVLERLAAEIQERHQEELVEPPEVISEAGELAAKTQLTLVAKARFGQGARLRRQLIEEVHRALTGAGIEELG